MKGYAGIPFVDGGRDRSGTDCWGLVRLYLSETFGLDLPTYSETPASDLTGTTAAVAAAMGEGTWRRVDEPREGDVVVMRGWEMVSGRTTRTLRHVGVVTYDGRLLHVEAGTDSVVVPFNHASVRHRIESFWRHRDLR